MQHGYDIQSILVRAKASLEEVHTRTLVNPRLVSSILARVSVQFVALNKNMTSKLKLMTHTTNMIPCYAESNTLMLLKHG
jgi:hypothetical protein